MKTLSNYELCELIGMAREMERTHNKYCHVTDKCQNFNNDLRQFIRKLEAEIDKREL